MNSVTTNDDTIAHGNRKKDNILTISPENEITSYIIFCAGRGLF